LCGAVRYGIATTLKHITHCHCSMCRKQHGAAFATHAAIGTKHLRIEDARGKLRSYMSSPGITRQFCADCGSSLFWKSADFPKIIGVAIGTLDDDPHCEAFAHIFVASKAPWFPITDALPQYAESTPDPESAS
jgi:hypothetical protein